MQSDTVEIFRRNSRELQPIATEVKPRLKKLANVEAVMFDVYGTLFISGSGDVGYAATNPKENSLVAAAEACGIPVEDSAKVLMECFYETIKDSHKQSREQGIPFPEVDIVQIWKETFLSFDFLTTYVEEERMRRFAVEFESRSNPVWPMPQLEETLVKISAKFPMGIVSNAQFFTLDLFEAFLDADREKIGFHADLEVFSYAEGQAKPGREIYEIAAKRLEKLDIPSEKVLYVGNDMLNDIRGAYQVGFRTALFAGDQRSLRLRKEDQSVDGLEPDIIVNCLSQLLECV